MGRMGVGNGSARRVGRPPRRRGSGHDKMFSWDAGCQRWLPVPNALKAQKKNCVTLFSNTPAGAGEFLWPVAGF